MARRLLILYLALVLGPLVAASLAFAIRDRLPRRRPAHRADGHGRPERLVETVEEVRAS